MLPSLSGNALLLWIDDTSRHWHDLLAAHPEALLFPCDIRETHNVGELVQHIVAVELRYAERLQDLPETPYNAVPLDSADSLFATHERATALLHGLEDRDAAFWEGVISFQTRSAGTRTATRAAIFAHLLLHSARHYAQLTTLVRHGGVPANWPMDFLFSPAAAL